MCHVTPEDKDEEQEYDLKCYEKWGSEDGFVFLTMLFAKEAQASIQQEYCSLTAESFLFRCISQLQSCPEATQVWIFKVQ